MAKTWHGAPNSRRSSTRKLRRTGLIPYIDPLDVRYRKFEPQPKPVAQAVMFCLMDVSGSMTEHMKDLAKRFYVLLYIFLKRRYKHVDVVFIRHTHQAQEVDEDTFFHSPETGGTVVSTALEEMQRVIDERYSPDSWNIYAAQASDGDNTASDNDKTASLLINGILPVCQYYAYLEVGRDSEHFPPGFIRRDFGPVADLHRDLQDRRADGDAQGGAPARHLSGIPRAVRQEAGNHGSRDSMNDFGGGIRAERPLFEGADWEFGTIQRVHDAIEKIAVGELGLDVYPNQIEIIGTEQMLDAYSSIGMPLFYKHWSFGKHFARNEAMYRAGMQGLAYEIVINSNPCISYIMEENTATMQTLVIAHAAFGHNHFFKNNYVFKQWTDADGILDYLEFARGYIAHCEERYGEAQVERLLDAAHALMSHGVHRYPRRRVADLRSEEQRAKERRVHDEQVFNDLWRTVPSKGAEKEDKSLDERRRALLQLPQENVLYFLEKTAPRLQPWQREILRIVRMIAQYFYPQSQTKLMNEGCATYTHYRIMNRLHEKGQLTDGNMVEFLRSHTNVVFQPDFDDPRYSGINPYALGLRHDARHRAHLHRTDGRGPELVPRHRRRRRSDGGAARGMGELSRRKLHPAVSQSATDPRVRPVPRARRCQRAEPERRGDPRRARLPQDPARAGAAVRHRLEPAGHPGGGREPRRRPPPDPAPSRAQPGAAGGARRALRAAASGRSLGLRRPDEGDRSGHRTRCSRNTLPRRAAASSSRTAHSAQNNGGLREAQPATINPLQRQRLLEPAPPTRRPPAESGSDWSRQTGSNRSARRRRGKDARWIGHSSRSALRVSSRTWPWRVVMVSSVAGLPICWLPVWVPVISWVGEAPLLAANSRPPTPSSAAPPN